MESFHSTLQFELLAEHPPFPTRVQARQAIANYLDYYNHERRHSTCRMQPPTAYEHAQQHKKAA